MELLWGALTPLLFGSIGAALDFSKIQWNIIGWVILILFVGVIFRTLAAYLCVYAFRFFCICVIYPGIKTRICGLIEL